MVALSLCLIDHFFFLVSFTLSYQEHRHFCTKLKEKLGEAAAQEKINKEREKFYSRMAALSADLKKKEELLATFAQTASRPIFAFVTFDRAAGREAILDAFNGSSFLYNYLYNQHYKLKDCWLKLEQSPEPSTILWENLAYGKWESGRRRLLTSIIALLMIFISLAMIFSAKYLEEVNNQESANELCPSDFDTYTVEEKELYVEENPDQLSCYCDELSTVEQSTDPLCRNYLRKNVQSQLLTYFASLIVLLVNILIEKVLKWLSAYEKHNSEDARGTSTFLRLFILKYINTTLVFFINNNNVILQQIFGVVTKSTTEFTADWFNTIGVTVILVQMGDIFSCHGDVISKWFFFHRRKRAARVNELALTQDDLNQSQVGPEFEFAFSYAQLLSTFFCCFTFSTGIPLLYCIAMMNYLTYYFVEKYMFIHLYRIPPHFSNSVGKRASSILPYAFILHLAMSIWVLSNKELFINEETDSNGSAQVRTGSGSVEEKISGTATFPLFVFLIGILAIRLFTHLYKGSAHTFTWVSVLFLSGCKYHWGQIYFHSDLLINILQYQNISFLKLCVYLMHLYFADSGEILRHPLREPRQRHCGQEEGRQRYGRGHLHPCRAAQPDQGTGDLQHPAEPHLQGEVRHHLEVRDEQQERPQRAQQQGTVCRKRGSGYNGTGHLACCWHFFLLSLFPVVSLMLIIYIFYFTI